MFLFHSLSSIFSLSCHCYFSPSCQRMNETVSALSNLSENQNQNAQQLRYLQTLNSISAEKNSTIVFPVPIDIISRLLGPPNRRIDEDDDDEDVEAAKKKEQQKKAAAASAPVVPPAPPMQPPMPMQQIIPSMQQQQQHATSKGHGRMAVDQPDK